MWQTDSTKPCSSKRKRKRKRKRERESERERKNERKKERKNKSVIHPFHPAKQCGFLFQVTLEITAGVCGVLLIGGRCRAEDVDQRITGLKNYNLYNFDVGDLAIGWDST